jgi:hypothetical protein
VGAGQGIEGGDLVSVSVERAAQCIGRLIQHDEPFGEVKGRVERVTQFDVWVKENDGSVTPCIPENMSWVSTLHEDLAEAIVTGDTYENAQVCYTPDYETAFGELAYDLGIVYSPPISNDDDQCHSLYAVSLGTRRVHVLRYNAEPSTAWEIEELLGWATP